jgi:hypothetical protein
MDKFAFVDTTPDTSVSNDALELIEPDSTFKDFEHGGNGSYAYCVIA